jgi:CubicO group peptidase (beta-lactamase class C family)
VDRGQVDLHADVNRYLRRLQVPTTYPEPVTLAHLLTHTAGFDELPGVRLARSREEMMPLADFLRGRLVRVRPPGHVTSYSSFGAALAGALVEEVSGLAYEAYLVRHVFRPLGMRRAHVTPSAEEAAALATGYDVQGGAPRPAAYEWYHTTPAGAINATATDMARFMSMLLGHQREGVRVLSEQSRRAMLRRQATMHGAIPGWGYGLQEHEINGQRIFEHGGDIAGFSALMVLLPEHDVGLFVATHREGSQLRFQLEQALLDRLFPDRRAPPARPPRGTRASVEPFVGTYRWNIYCRTCAVPSQQPTWTVAANDDGTITVAGKRWILTGPLLFRSEDGKSQLGFATDSTGRVMHLTSGAWRVMERVR